MDSSRAAGAEFTSSGLLLVIELAKTRAGNQLDGLPPSGWQFGCSATASFNLDYLLSFPAGMAKNWLFSRQAILEVGGFNTELADAFELDLILRLLNQGGMEGLAHIAEPLLMTPAAELANIEHERVAIEQHLHVRGYSQAEIHAPLAGRYQVRYNHPQQPIVSILLAAGTRLDQLQRCIEGLLAQRTIKT